MLVVIIAFSAIVPNLAQSSMDNAQLNQLYLSMMAPTENNITINATIQIVNAGSFAATVASSTATLFWETQKLGTLSLPSISIEATTGGTFSLLSPLQIATDSEKAVFQNMSTALLKGNDVTLTLKASPTLKPKVIGISLPKYKVDLKKDLVIPGAALQTPYIRHIRLTNFTETAIFAAATIEFSMASSLHLFGGALEVDVYDADRNKLGVAKMPDFRFQRGYNAVRNISVEMGYCDKCSNTGGWNNASINNFANETFEGKATKLNIIGPTGKLVISDTLTQDIMVYPPCPPPDSN